MRIFFLFMIMGFVSASFGRQQATDSVVLSGRVKNDEGKAVEGATVTLWQRHSEWEKWKALSSDANGTFSFLLDGAGFYRIEISFTGFTRFILDSILIRKDEHEVTLPDIMLKRMDDNTLNDVVVVHTRPMFETRDGTITMHMDATPMAAGSSGAELLRNMPMVATDPEGRLLVKGKQPVILIDEKPVELNGQQLADLLESLPGIAIEKIEMMQNPPPQYANSEGGVINIVTKKGALGWMGKFTLMAGTIGQGNANINLNYRNKKITFSGVAGINAGRVTGHSYALRENYYPDSTNQFITEGDYTNRNTRPNFRLQATYDATKRQQWSVTLMGNGNWYENQSLTTYKNINRFGDLWRISKRTNHSDGENYSLQTQLGYTWFGTNRAEKLQVVATYTPGNTLSNRLFFQEYLSPELDKTGVDSTQGQANRNPAGNGSFRADYQKPLNKNGLTLTAGAVLSVINQHNVLETLLWNKATGKPELSPSLSTDNRFRQQVFSLRSGLNMKLGKSWHANVNLQAEGTHFDFRFAGDETETSNDYINFLPSITVRKDLNKLLKSSLVYRKTVRRAGMAELNPAIDYSDPYNLRFGNPSLLPTQADNFDFNLNWNNGKSYINGSLGYNKVRDIINRIRTLMPDGSTYATFENVATRTEYEAGIWSGYSFSKKFRLNLSASYVFNAYAQKEKDLLKYQDGSSVTMNLNGNYMLSPVLSFDGSFRYNAFADPQGRSRSNLSTQIGVQYKVFDRRLILAAAAIDPFTRQEITTYTRGANFSIDSYRTAITRNFRLSVSWVLQQKAKAGNRPK